MSLQLTVAGKTDIGLVRSGNEDYLHLDEKNFVYAVCDGMGGHQAGEVASMTASQTLQMLFNNFQKELTADKLLDIGRPLPQSGDLLLRAIRLANRAIYQQAQKDTSKSGMGTTIVSVAFEADLMSIAHVGDSRAYRLDENQLTPLTRDHSWVSEIQASQHLTREEAESVVGKNVITRALGVRENVEVDYRLVRVRPGDIIILCSDGLCGFADDEEIFSVANKVRPDVEAITDNLIQLAKEHGGADNITVITIRVEEVPSTSIPEVDVITLPVESPEVLAHEDEWIEKINTFVQQQEEQNNTPEEQNPNKFLLAVIFIAFVAVAAAIIYYTTAGK